MLVEYAERNVRRNFDAVKNADRSSLDGKDEESSVLEFRCLEWESAPENDDTFSQQKEGNTSFPWNDYQHQFDVLIGGDIIYTECDVAHLVRCICALLKRDMNSHKHTQQTQTEPKSEQESKDLIELEDRDHEQDLTPNPLNQKLQQLLESNIPCCIIAIASGRNGIELFLNEMSLNGFAHVRGTLEGPLWDSDGHTQMESETRGTDGADIFFSYSLLLFYYN